MRTRFLNIPVILALLFSVTLAGFTTTKQVVAQAYVTSFITSITYQNVDTITATVTLQFYAESSGTAITVSRPDLAAGAGTSIFVGSLSEISPGFRGSAVLQSTANIVATLVQVPQSTSVKNRPLSNGFSAGTSSVLIATVLKNQFSTTSVFSVQNVDTDAADFTLSFINSTSPGTPIVITTTNVPAGATKYYDAGLLTELPSPFNGSVTINAVDTGTANPGSVVATALELSTTGTGASAFESVSGGATTVYMASALCNAFGGTNTAYAVQNSDSVTASVRVSYSNGFADGPYDIVPGAKRSFLGCAPSGMPAGFSGSSTITSTANIVAIGKVTGLGLSTAFLGASSGSQKLALPYVRWSETQYDTGVRQKAFIAIQNVGAPLNASDVTVTYKDKNGATVGIVHALGALATGAKLNSNPLCANNVSCTAGGPADEFGYYTDGTFGGSVIVEGPIGSQLVVVVRVQSKVTTDNSTVGEDYNGISY